MSKKVSYITVFLILLFFAFACEKRDDNEKRVYKDKDFLYRVFFSQVYSGSPGEAMKNTQNIDKKLIELIDMAEQNIYAALHELDNKDITKVLIDANNRGVEIKLVTETKYLKEASIKQLQELGIPIISDNRSALMHNKFIIVDREWIWTGSTNTTSNGFYKNNNNAILIRSKKLAENFILEFEEMFVSGQFGIRSPKAIKYPEVILRDNTKIKTLFAPENSVDKAIIKELEGAKQSIYFYAFSFTHDGIAKTIIDKHNKGLKIAGIFEDFQISKHSEFNLMRDEGIDVRKDNNPYFMHHKVIVIDKNTTITGSFNFSKNASKNNDENILIIESTDIAQSYLEEFNKLRN